jgi:hypothetical protein
MKNKATRKIYRRNGITHMCCKGGYFGLSYAIDASTGATSAVSYALEAETQFKAGDNVQATFTTDSVGHECVEVFLAIAKKKGIRETWYRVDVPRKERVEKDPSEYAQAQKHAADHKKKKAALENAGFTVVAA